MHKGTKTTHTTPRTGPYRQPLVHTVHVEAVLASQDTQLLPVLKVAKADAALQVERETWTWT